MKYNININQKALSKTSLDLFDCAILDYIIFYCSSVNEKIEKQRIRNENGVWTWINYQTLLKDMPLLKIKSSGALTPRIKKIEAEGYYETMRVGNQKLFIRINKKVDELFIEVNSSIHEDEQLLVKSCSRRRTNNNTNINNNTKDNNLEIKISKKRKDQVVFDIIDLFKSVNPSFERLFANKTQRSAIERLVKKHGEIKVKNMIDYLPKTIGKKFAPVITTPLQLENKLGNLVAFIQRQKNNKPNVVII